MLPPPLTWYYPTNLHTPQNYLSTFKMSLPRVHAQAVKQSVCLPWSVVCWHNLKSPDLDILASEQSICKHIQTVENLNKLTCVLFEWHIKAHRHYKSYIFWGHTYTCPCGFCPCAQNLSVLKGVKIANECMLQI